MTSSGQIPIRDDRDQLRAVFDALDGILVCDPDGVIVEANATAAAMFAVSRDRLIGSRLEDLSTGAPSYGQVEALAHFAAARGRGVLRFDWPCRAADGRQFWCEIALRPADLAGRPTVLAALRDITERKEREEGLLRTARRDPLTGLPNHRDLVDVLQHEVARYERYGGYMCLALGEADAPAGTAPDRRGPPDGDAVLVTVGEFLRGRLRKSDYMARWTGEAFAMLLHDTKPDTATRMLNRTRTAIENHAATKMGRPLALLFGVTAYKLSDTANDLIERAERALALARQASGNRLVTV